MPTKKADADATTAAATTDQATTTKTRSRPELVKTVSDSVEATTDKTRNLARRVGDRMRQRPAPVAAVFAGVVTAAGAVLMVVRRRQAMARTRSWRRWR
jgi:hypothetical protein